MSERLPDVLSAVFLGISGVTIWVAALMPQLFPVWLNRDPLTVIGDNLTAWRVNSILFLVSAIAALVGCALAVPPTVSPFATPSLLLLMVATSLWTIDLSLRLSVIATVAQDRGEDAEGWLFRAQAWSTATWYVAAGCLILAFAGIGLAALTSEVLPGWAGWVCLGSAAFSIVVLTATRDMPPIVVYLPLLPLAVAVIIPLLRKG